MPDWAKSDIDLVRQTVQEAEIYLQGQVTLATSADQRAAVLGGIFMAAGTAIVVGLATLISTSTLTTPLLVGGIATAALFLTAAGLCLSTTLPVKFDLPGNEPESWYDDIDQKKPLVEALGEEAVNFQTKIEDNRLILKRNAKRFRWGALSGISAPIVGAVVWGLVSL